MISTGTFNNGTITPTNTELDNQLEFMYKNLD